MESQPGEQATGVVKFEQDSEFEACQISGLFKNLTPNHKHGFHIHQYGDLSEGCKTAGPHWNPEGKTHGGPGDSERHYGDLGNVQSDSNGNGEYKLSDHLVSLFGETSVIGRSCVLHKQTDDLGRGGDAESKKTGNAGARISCGTIGLRA